MKRLFLLFGLFIIAGCGPGDGDKVTVTGVVLCDNKPLDGASIAFIGNGGGAYGSAISDKQGKFSIRAAPGKNKVAVSKLNPADVPPVTDPYADQTMPTGEEATKIMKAAPKPFVAEKFTDPDKSGIVIDVVANMASVDLNVTSK
jgi:hypothetical protein